MFRERQINIYNKINISIGTVEKWDDTHTLTKIIPCIYRNLSAALLPSLAAATADLMSPHQLLNINSANSCKQLNSISRIVHQWQLFPFLAATAAWQHHQLFWQLALTQGARQLCDLCCASRLREPESQARMQLKSFSSVKDIRQDVWVESCRAGWAGGYGQDAF